MQSPSLEIFETDWIKVWVELRGRIRDLLMFLSAQVDFFDQIMDLF